MKRIINQDVASAHVAGKISAQRAYTPLTSGYRYSTVRYWPHHFWRFYLSGWSTLKTTA